MACNYTDRQEIPQISAPSFNTKGTTEAPDEWWQSFNDPVLNTHIDTALKNNFDLAAAWSRLRAARAIAAREEADLYPDINLQADAARRDNDNGGDEEEYTFGPMASYEIDLWGGHSRECGG